MWLNIKVCKTVSVLNSFQQFLFVGLKMVEDWSVYMLWNILFFIFFSVSWPGHVNVASTNAIYLPLV